MTDRELLELAALAAGVGGGWDIPRGRNAPVCYRRDGGETWNPLTDDGDALRLAVKLRLLDEHAGFTYELAVQMGRMDDPYAATRRAIVRAAAEIGRSMKATKE